MIMIMSLLHAQRRTKMKQWIEGGSPKQQKEQIKTKQTYRQTMNVNEMLAIIEIMLGDNTC